jgi:hypothetical protein
LHQGRDIGEFLVGKKVLIISEVDGSSTVVAESHFGGITSLNGTYSLLNTGRPG